jgi:hypothetical protein
MPIDRSERLVGPPTLLGMDIDAALILFSFLSFGLLLVSWMLAPMRAAAPTAAPVTEAAAAAA